MTRDEAKRLFEDPEARAKTAALPKETLVELVNLSGQLIVGLMVTIDEMNRGFSGLVAAADAGAAKFQENVKTVIAAAPPSEGDTKH